MSGASSADHARPAVDRRRIQPGVRRAGPDRGLARRPVRPPAGAADRVGRVRAFERCRGGRVLASALVAVRFVMGMSAAIIFPTMLSIITNAFPDRRERARAIGLWGAVTGLGVAIGPVGGGLLLAHFGWPSGVRRARPGRAARAGGDLGLGARVQRAGRGASAHAPGGNSAQRRNPASSSRASRSAPRLLRRPNDLSAVEVPTALAAPARSGRTRGLDTPWVISADFHAASSALG